MIGWKAHRGGNLFTAASDQSQCETRRGWEDGAVQDCGKLGQGLRKFSLDFESHWIDCKRSTRHSLRGEYANAILRMSLIPIAHGIVAMTCGYYRLSPCDDHAITLALGTCFAHAINKRR